MLSLRKSLDRRHELRLLVLCTLSVLPTLTRAQTAPLDPVPPLAAAPSAAQAGTTSPALAQLERELTLHAAEEHRLRIAEGVVGLVMGGTLLPAGLVLEHRKDSLVRLIGIGTIIGGAVQLTRLPGLFIPADMERILARHQRRKASGLTGDALVRETEKDWQHEAERERMARHISGAIHLGVAAAFVPLGLTILLKHSVGSWSHPRQVNIGSTFLGIGSSFVALGTELLFNKGASQRTWDVHERTRPEVSGLASARFGAAPVAHGGVLAAHGTF